MGSRALEDVDFHVRHIDRLLGELGPESWSQLDLALLCPVPVA